MLVVEQVEIVCGGDSDDVVARMPARVEYLLCVVERVHADLVAVAAGGRGQRALAATAAVGQRVALERGRTVAVARHAAAVGHWRGRPAVGGRTTQLIRVDHTLGLEQLTRLRLLARTLEHELLLAVAVERLEQVVVRAAENLTDKRVADNTNINRLINIFNFD